MDEPRSLAGQHHRRCTPNAASLHCGKHTPHQHARVDLDLQEAERGRGEISAFPAAIATDGYAELQAPRHGTHIRGILAAHAEEMETAARRRSRPGGACRAVETVRGIEESRRDEKEDFNNKNDENGS